MSLSALPTALLIPPANLVPLGLAGLLLARCWPRLGRAMTAGALLLLLMLSMPAVSGVLIESLQAGIPRLPPATTRQQSEAPAETPVQTQPGAIIVLSADGGGAGIGGILPPHGLGAMTLERLQAGAILSRRLALPLLVTGGSLAKGAPPIAVQMARSLQQDFGLSAAWIEPRSADTWENAKFSADILHASGIRTAYIVTNAWHMRRALIAFRHFGIDAIPAASRFNDAPGWEVDAFIPQVTTWLVSYYAVHEWIGCAYYVLRR